MKRLFTLLFLLFAFLCSSAATETYSRARIILDKTGHTLSILSGLGVAIDHGDYKPGAYFVSDFSSEELRQIKDAGFAVEIIIEDVVQYYRQQNKNFNAANYRLTDADPEVPSHFSLGSYGGYFTYDEMLVAFKQMHDLYPQLISEVQQVDTFKSVEGRPILWLKISNGAITSTTPKPQVLYTALHHAREPGSLSQLVFYLWYLLDNYDKDEQAKAIVDHTELYFMPCINPDGYIYNIQTDPGTGGMWRKNRRSNTNDTYGVDLNRNYGFRWGNDLGSDRNLSSEVYRGPEAFSEPETRAVKWFTENHRFLIALNHHTFSNVLIYPWGASYISAEAPENKIYTTFARTLTRKNKYRYGVTNEVLNYYTSGDANDWMYGEQDSKSKVFSFIPEVGASFYSPANQIVPDCKNALSMNLNAAALLLPFAATESTDSAVLQNLNGQLNYDITFCGFPEQGTFTVSIEPLDQWMNPATTTRVYSDYKMLQSLSDSLPYSLKAAIPYGQTVRYLLKVNNGYYTKSDTVAFNYKEIPLKLSVYPNPAKDRLTIAITGMAPVVFPLPAVLYNAGGQRIRDIWLTDKITEVDVSMLPEMVYFLKPNHNTDRFPVTKVVLGK